MYSHNTHLRTQFLTRQNYFQSESSKLTVLDLNLSILITPPLVGMGHCAEPVCLYCMCVLMHISRTIHPNFTKVSVHAACGGGSVLSILLLRRCNRFNTILWLTSHWPSKDDASTMSTQSDLAGQWAESDGYNYLVLSRNETNINSRSHNRDDAHLICSRIISLHYSCLIDWFRSSDIFA